MILGRLQRVILKENKIEGHLVETRFTRCHVTVSLTGAPNLVLAVFGYPGWTTPNDDVKSFSAMGGPAPVAAPATGFGS